MGRPRAFDWDEAARLRADGWTLPAIAAHLGVSVNAVKRAINPDFNARQQACSHAGLAARKKPCRGGCGTLVWTHTKDASGWCQACSPLLRQNPAQHGSEARYRSGCRCDECRATATAARRARRQRSAA